MQDENKKYSELEQLDLERPSPLILYSRHLADSECSVRYIPGIGYSISVGDGSKSSPKPPSSSTDPYMSSDYIIRPYTRTPSTNG